MIAFTATTDSDETTPTAALATTVSQQTSTTGSSSSAVMDDTTTATDSQTDTGIYIYMTYVIMLALRCRRRQCISALQEAAFDCIIATLRGCF